MEVPIVLLLELKFTGNKAVLDIKNAGKDTQILRPEKMIGIVDIRSLGYYKIKQGRLQQNLKKQGNSVNILTYLLTC